MVQIDDGGKHGTVKVSKDNRLDTSARSAQREYYESRDEGQVYVAVGVDAAAAQNEETFYLKNTHTTKDMIIEEILISSDTASIWRVKFVTDIGTVTGTVITPTNLNKGSSNSAVAECRGGAAGVANLTDAGDVALFRVGAAGTHHHTFHEALRLGQDDAIAIECETAGAVEFNIFFHYDSE